MKMLIVNCLIAICALGVCAGDNDGFISRWLICGPFPSYEVKGQDGGTGLDTDFLNGEANARPVPGKKYETVFLADESKMIVALDVTNEWGVRNSRTITSEWKEMSFPNPRKILMDEVFPPIKDHFVFFAACYIESPRAQEIRIRLGSDDDHKLYLNGEMIGRAPTCQDATPRFVYKAKLKRGLNLLLLKVVDRIFDCGFCLALEKPDGSVLDNVKLYADSPARKLGAEAYDNGFAVNFNVPAKTLYDDDKKMQLNIRFFAPDQNPYTLKLGEKQTTLTNDGTWELEVPLRSGNVELCCRVFDADGKDVAELSRQLQVYSRTPLKQQRAKLEREDEVLKRQQEALRSELAANRDRLNKAKQELELARKSAEDNYAKIRKEAEKDAAASIDERFKPAPGLRSSLLLNGVWRAGEKQGKLDSSLRLPLEMYGPFYRLWNYPDDIYSNEKNRFSVKMCPLPGYKDCVFNELICSKKVTFEQDFTFDGTGGDVYFVCDNIIGNAEVFCNGVSCGKYSGTVGLVEMKLKNLKKDKNTLRIDYSVTPLITDQEASCYGIVGDLRLEYRNPVHVADVWIRPSWRKASLRLTSEIFNPEKTPVSYKLLQYAVRNDHVKFRFPEKSGRLAPDEVTIVDQETKWRDPELYSLENPCLYDLVSDLYIDDRLVDRKVDSFGFREFWIHGVDFFYNGKRFQLQGDLGVRTFAVGKAREVIFPLLRHDNINILRLHDAYCHTRPDVAEAADRYGMFLIAQLYPQGDFSRKKDSSLIKQFGSADAFRRSSFHKLNLNNYRNWHRLMRNHPSILIWSIDNELVTPGCDSRGLEKRNEIVDDIADTYYEFVKSLDPELIVTRDGDSCTYDSGHYRFRADTPANVHYPEFHKDWFVYDWQRKFEYRPALFGETLYCSYVWGDWPGPESPRVEKKAKQIRETVRLYREQGIPAAIYMGLSLDGFVELKADGSGSPWGVTEVPKKQRAERPANWHNGRPENEYPYIRINWPSASGRGIRPEYQRNEIYGFGYMGINWSSGKYLSHVRNAVNDAYRDSLIQQPPLADPQIAEVIVVADPNVDVYTTLSDGCRYGVRADEKGLAWFILNGKGIYEFEWAGRKKKIDLSGPRDYASSPGLDKVPIVPLKN